MHRLSQRWNSCQFFLCKHHLSGSCCMRLLEQTHHRVFFFSKWGTHHRVSSPCQLWRVSQVQESNGQRQKIYVGGSLRGCQDIRPWLTYEARISHMVHVWRGKRIAVCGFDTFLVHPLINVCIFLKPLHVISSGGEMPLSPAFRLNDMLVKYQLVKFWVRTSGFRTSDSLSMEWELGA